MNWSGLVIGVSLALCLLGGVITAFARTPRAATGGLAAAMLGVAGACLTMGHEYLALVIAGIGGAMIPSVMILALHAGAQPETDRRPRGARRLATATILLLVLFAVARVMTGAVWPAAGGTLQDGIEWLGTRLLTDQLLLLDLAAALLAVTACAAVALLRGRTARR